MRAVVTCWILASLFALRVEHLLAGVVWLGRRSLKCYESKRFKRARTAKERWAAYQHYDGGKLPWLFFGMRAHRLRAWEEERSALGWRRIRAYIATAVRLTWFYGGFGIVGAVMVILLTSPLGGQSRTPLLLCAFLLVAGSFVLAVEGSICLVKFHSWGDKHHRIKSETIDMSEVKAAGGSGLVAYAATVALVWVSAKAFGAFPEVANEGSTLQQLADVMQNSIAFTGQNAPNYQGAVGAYATLAIRFLWAAYLLATFFLFGWAARLRVLKT